jgi:spermidine synthase
MLGQRVVAGLIYIIFFLSGIAGLGYEIVWTRMFAVGLGHELPSLLAVVAAFFGGVALGAWGLDGPVSRSRVPGRWYAVLEVVIGVWALGSTALIPWANSQVARLIGETPGFARHWAVAFVVPLLILLPATAAMGATLPAMDRFFSRLRAEGRSIGGLYGANTLGAVAGTLLTTFFIVPAVGFRLTILILAAINLVCAGAVLIGPARAEEQRAPVHAEMPDVPGGWRLGATVLVTGLLGIGYEVLVVRVMNQALENTVYSFASALSVYLLGTAIGAVLYQARAPRGQFRAVLTSLLEWLAAACLLGVLVLWQADDIYDGCRRVFGGGFGGSVAAEMILALLVFFLPSLLMGATFSHLAQAARRAQGGVGKALGLNTFGAALAPFLFGVLLLPLLGGKFALLLVALGYFLLVPDFRLRSVAVAAGALVLIALLPFNLILVQPPPGGRVLAYRDGVMAAVAIVDNPRGHRFLKVNDRFIMGGTQGAFGDRRMGQIPLLLHPNPRRALYLGLGTGITFGAAASHPDLKAEGVELIPDVVNAIPFFREFIDGNRRQLEFKIADARRYIRASPQAYDVIVADLFHPSRDGAGALYTLEHFRAIRERLAPGGLFCQWLPLYQLDVEMLRVIARTFLQVFPETRAYIAHFNVLTPALGLVGTVEPRSYPTQWFEQRVRDPALIKALEDIAMSNGLALFGCLVAGRENLASFAGAGPFNSDDLPLVIFGAPRFTYGPEPAGYEVLKVLMDTLHPDASAVIAAGGSDADRDFVERLNRYLSARKLYLEGSILRANRRQAEALEAYVETARISRDFRVGYSVAVELVRQQAAFDLAGARKILLALQEADPSRSEAFELLDELNGSALAPDR